jgi:subtilisin-like proprotein convertase family protein
MTIRRTLFLQSFAFFAAASVFAATTDYETTTTGTFDNNTGSPLIRTINVSSSLTVGDLNVGINLEHTWRGDVRVTLESPQGTRVEIIALPTADSDDHFDVLLDSASVNPLDDNTNNNTGSPFYDRTCVATNTLDAFNGENPQGDWKLEFVDLNIGASSNRIGTFNRAKLSITDATTIITVRPFDDKYWNGTYEPTIDTTAVTGVTMTLTDQSGTAVTATYNGDGTYSFDYATLSGNSLLLAVDSATLPAGYFPGVVRGASKPMLSVVNVSAGPPATIEIPVQVPKLECLVAADFDMFTTCFVGGPHDNRNAVNFLDENGTTRTMIPATSGAVLAFPRPAASSTKSTQNRYLATIEEVGSTYGLAVQDTDNRVYAGTFSKRHSDFGPSGSSGTIYVIDSGGGGVLDTFTIPGTGTTAHAVDATNAANNGLDEGWLRDSNYFDVVGREGLGDVEINAAKTIIWTINLNNRHLYMVDVADPTLVSYGTITDLGEVTNAACPGTPSIDWRPFALEWHDGNLYVGGTCTGQSNQSAANMEIHVFRVSNPTSPGSISYTQVYDSGSLTYVRGQATIEWSPWITAWDIGAFGTPPNATFATVYPQPWLTDFEFDNNHNLILGLRDRFGDQIGINTKSPGNGTTGDSAGDNGLYETVSMGDILQAHWNPTTGTDVTSAVLGDWALEGTFGSQSDDPNDGVTAQEFYAATSFETIHPETAQGALAFHPDFPNEIATTAQDPFSLRSGGVSFFSTINGTSPYQNGTAAGGHQVYGGQNTSTPGQSLLGKANGLGDIEYSCATTGQQIGNRVWLDEDTDGIQDPSEVSIAGAAVYLYVDLNGDGIYDDSTGDSTPDPITFTTTDANGQWLFSTHANTAYAVVIDTSTAPVFNDSSSTPVVVADLSPTVANAGSGSNETTDSDLGSSLLGFPAIELVTDPIGVSSHNLDAGFTPAELVAIGNLVFNDVNGDGDFDSLTESGIAGVAVELWLNGGGEILVGPDGALGTADDAVGGVLTDGSGCYLFSGLPVGTYYVKIPSGEFASGEPLYGLVSSTGQGSDDATDDNGDENGDDNEADGVTSNAVALSTNEPTGEAGKFSPQSNDANTNLTVDFGFTCPIITLAPSSLPNGVVGSAYSETLSASGGTSPYSYTLTAGSLPGGLNLIGDEISGTPNSDAAATFTITATDAIGCSVAVQYTVNPVCPTITLSSTPSTLPSGTIGSAYSATINASGGTANYTFALKSGSSLPAGLSMAANGAITGTPTGPEATTNFTVVATDNYGCTGEATFSIGIDCNTLVVTPTSLASGSVGVAYGPVNFSAGGATGGVTWTLSSGSLPADMDFTGGVLSGTPTEGGSFPISVTATDGNNCSGSVSLILSIPVAVISGTIYADTDDDGDGDVAINVVTVSVCNSSGNPADNPNITGVQDYVVTTTNGTYQFTNLVPGSYIVKETQPTGYLTVTELDSTTDAGGSPADDPITVVNQIPVNVANGETDSGNDFVEVQPLSLGDLVFCDEDNDGIKDGSEPGIIDVVVHLLRDANNDGDVADPGEEIPFATDTTVTGGAYLFENLRSGFYQVVIPVSNFAKDAALEFKTLSSTPTDTVDNGENNDDNGTQASVGTVVTSPLIELTLGGEPGSAGLTNFDDTIDFGFVDQATLVGIGNLIFFDSNGNGIFDGFDIAVPDVVVELYTPGGDGQPGGGDDVLVSTTATGALASGKEGCYEFVNLAAGDYFVKVPAAEFTGGGNLVAMVSMPGYGGDVFDDDGSDENGIDAGAPAVNGVTSGVINLAAGAEPTGGQENGKDAGGDDAYDNNINYTVDLGFVPSATTVGLGNKVFIDGNSNGAYDGTPTDTPVGNVTLQLFNASAGPGVGSVIATTTSDANGCYAFTGLTSGESYIVHIPASEFAGSAPLGGLVSVPGNGVDDEVDDDLGENGIDSGSPEVSGISSSPIALTAATEPVGESGADGAGDAADSNTDFTIDFAMANASTTVGIGNLVFIDSDRNGVYTLGEGVDGVTVELYASGQSTSTPAFATTTTVNGGCYVFTGLTSGNSYFVHIPATEFQTGGGLEGSYSITGQGTDNGVDDGTDENGADPVDPSVTGVSTGDIALAVGAEPVDGTTETGKDAAGDNGGVDANIDYTVDLGFTVEKVSTFTAWQTDNPLGGNNGPLDNPDGDIYNNALEYALCLKPEDGTPTTEPGGPGGFCAELNSGSGNVDAFYVRPEVANDVTYTLQTSATPGNPTTWTDRTDLTPTVTSNSDGTETVRSTDLEAAVGSKGIVRLKVEIAGDGTGPHYTQVWGWNAQTLPAGCQTWSNPYASKGIYSGTAVDTDYAAGVLTSTAGGDVSSLLELGKEYYIEFIDGIYEGHRFDLDEGSTTASAIAFDTANARNTLNPVPADLQGAYEIRAHSTIDDLLPPDSFTAHNNSGVGDRLLLFVNGGWTIVWAYDPVGVNPVQWTRTFGALSDAGDIIVDPCAGLFTHPRLATVDLVSVGVVRDWDFACALNTGYNLVGSGYPLDQTPTDRAMLRGAGDGVAQDYFTSNANPLLADQLMHWLGDDVLGVEGYKTYYDLYVPSTSYDYWTDQTNSNLTNENLSTLFKQQRATFYDLITGHDRSIPAEVWVMPTPWAP